MIYQPHIIVITVIIFESVVCINPIEFVSHPLMLGDENSKLAKFDNTIRPTEIISLSADKHTILVSAELKITDSILNSTDFTNRSQAVPLKFGI